MIGQLIGVILGAIEGILLHKIFEWVWYDSGTEVISGTSIRDILVAVIGIVQVMFGQKIHVFLKYMGYGVVAWQVGWELAGYIWGAIPSPTQGA